MRTRTQLLVLLTAGLLVLALGLSGASAGSVDPVLVPGNPDCQDLGYTFGFKPQPEPPPTGAYYFGDPVTVPAHPATGDSVTISSDGTYFDWVSTLSLDAVIVKGGPNANVYHYDPEASSDTGLNSPINVSNGRPFAISHIEFCYDFELDISKTVEALEVAGEEQWTLAKTVDPALHQLFKGDSAESQYQIGVTLVSFTPEGWFAAGDIIIVNNTPFDATITDITDAVSVVPANVYCGPFPITLGAGDALRCAWDAVLPDGSTRINTATVTTEGLVSGGEATAEVAFSESDWVIDPVTVIDEDLGIERGGITDSAVLTLAPVTFACDADQGKHLNTVRLVDEAGFDVAEPRTAEVMVECYDLEVAKSADEAFRWSWDVDKKARYNDLPFGDGPLSLLLSEGQLHEVDYQVTFTPTAVDHTVGGWISVYNPAPIGAMINDVTDIVSPDIAADVACYLVTGPSDPPLVTFPFSLGSEWSISCDYSAELPDGATRTNTATAELQNYHYPYGGDPILVGTTDFTGAAAVDFTGVIGVDECASMYDSNNPAAPGDPYLGNACAPGPTMVSYSLWFGRHPDADVFLECGPNTHTNAAGFLTWDLGLDGFDSLTVNAYVSCDVGCTLTQGYWKTHSEYGPAPYDDTWALLPAGADTLFFASGETYYTILHTPPKGGNAWIILAHQYIAAELNLLNGASIPPDVQAAFDAAAALLDEYDGRMTIPKRSVDRSLAIDYYGILDDYNNGLLGPGHCTE